MTRNLYALPIAATLALSLSACGRDEDRTAAPENTELPARTAQAPGAPEHPGYDPNYSDPSIPQNPANKDTKKRDSSPPPGSKPEPGKP
jgi:hypothetical protein